MAPEILKHMKDGTKPEKFQNMELNKGQDIYSLGLILYELSHKMKTNMQKVELFKDLKVSRKLKRQCPLQLDKHIEYKLILKMTEEDPKKRPSALEIK